MIQGKNFCSNKECGKVEISSNLDLNVPFENFASDFTAQVLSYTHTEIAVAYTAYTGRIRIGVKGKGTEINYSNDNKIFAYRSPEIDDTTTSMLDMRRGETNGFNTRGNEELTITGRFFGDENNLVATINDIVVPITDYALISSVEQTYRIKVTTPEGQGIGNPYPNSTMPIRNVVRLCRDVVACTCRYVTSNCLRVPVLHYKPPSYTTMKDSRQGYSHRVFSPTSSCTGGVCSQAPTEGQQLVITGGNLGIRGKLLVDGQAINDTMYVDSWTHEEIMFRLPPGEGVDHAFALVVGDQSPSQAFARISYMVPSITDISPAGGGTLGGTDVTITGTNFGTVEPKVTVGGRVAQKVISFSHTQIVFKTPAGAGKDQQVVVETGSQKSVESTLFTYFAPSVDSIFPTSAPTSAVREGDGKQVLVTLTGSNFGSLAVTPDIQVHMEGVGIVNSSSFVSVDHTSLIFRLPEGQGENIGVRVSVGGQMSTAVKFSYDAPVITKILTGYCLVGSPPFDERKGFCSTNAECAAANPGVPTECISQAPTHGCRPDGFESKEAYTTSRAAGGSASRKCVGPHFIQVVGKNLGISGILAHVEGSSTATAPCALCDHGHTLVTVQAPIGIGANLSFTVTLPGHCDGDGKICSDDSECPTGAGLSGQCLRRKSNALLYSFDVPELTEAVPGTIQPYNAEGESLSLHGRNFGPFNSSVKVYLNGGTSLGWQACTDAVWQAADADGFPYVTCSAKRDVVGPKALRLTVAKQTVEVEIKRGVKTFSSVNSICEQTGPDANGDYTVYYGDTGQLCAKCPDGTRCQLGTTEEPLAKPGYWMAYLNISIPCTKAEYDAMEIKTTREAKLCSDYLRASGQDAQIGTKGGRCAPERWDRENFGFAITKDYCPDPVACQPELACTGNNTCAKEYRYVFKECNAYYETNGAKNCSTNMDCDPDQLSECSVARPWECSRCVRKSPDDEFGQCSCTHPTRCALCTRGEYYRSNNKCEECPNNPAL